MIFYLDASIPFPVSKALTLVRVRAFVLTTAGNYTRWQTLDLLVRRWADIEEIVATDEPPYIYAVRQQGLRRIPLGSN